MIRQTLWAAWLSVMTLCLLSLIPHDLPHATQIPAGIAGIFTLLVIFLSLGGFYANILQFGIDQLPDAASMDIVFFSNWFIWVYIVSRTVIAVSQRCVCDQYSTLAKLLLPSSLTIALCLDCTCNHWLIKEPVIQNPFKLIYGVMRYALKNKHPRQRSAFTYWDDKRYSRIDLAKQKFGGPYTTEEVEDVMTFWRMLVILITSTLFTSFFIAFLITYKEDMKQERSSLVNCSVEYFRNCLKREAINNVGFLVVLVFYPCYVVLRVFCLGRRLDVSILTKLNAGLFLFLMSMIGYLYIGFIEEFEPGANSTGQLREWVMIPNCLSSIGFFLALTAFIQFIYAQSPYSMKGLFFGLMYGCFGLSIAICSLLLLPVKFISNNTRRYELWYMLSVGIMLLLIFALLCFLSWRYKKRQRDDLQHNEQMFAINYYERYIPYNAVES